MRSMVVVVVHTQNPRNGMDGGGREEAAEKRDHSYVLRTSQPKMCGLFLQMKWRR